MKLAKENEENVCDFYIQKSSPVAYFVGLSKHKFNKLLVQIYVKLFIKFEVIAMNTNQNLPVSQAHKINMK